MLLFGLSAVAPAREVANALVADWTQICCAVRHHAELWSHVTIHLYSCVAPRRGMHSHVTVFECLCQIVIKYIYMGLPSLHNTPSGPLTHVISSLCAHMHACLPPVV